MLFGAPTERPGEHGQDAHSHERDVSDPDPSALRIRGLLQRRFALVQCSLALGLGRSHRLELLALGAQSRLRLVFTCADEVEVQGRELRRSLGPTRRPDLGLGDIIA